MWNLNVKWKCVLKVSLEICHRIKFLSANLPFLSPKELHQAAMQTPEGFLQEAFNRFPLLVFKVSYYLSSLRRKKMTHVQLYLRHLHYNEPRKQQVNLKNIARKQQQPKRIHWEFWKGKHFWFVSSLFSSSLPCLCLNARTWTLDSQSPILLRVLMRFNICSAIHRC